MLKAIMVRSVLIAFACALSVTAHAFAADSKRFDVPAGDLTAALESLAKQSGVEVVYGSEQLKGLRTRGVAGLLSPEEAVVRLLEGTKLTVRSDSSGAMLIAPRSKDGGAAVTPVETLPPSVSNFTTGAEVSDSGTAGKSGLLQRFRLAQAETTSQGGEAIPSQSSKVSDDSQKRVMEELIVTAQKREERLQDVPISISVLSGDYLERSTSQGVTDALRRVPGVAVNVSGIQSSGTQLMVRGVTAPALLSGSSPISYYLDSVPFGFVRQAIVPDVSAYDLERVEVLRGPQGTLYGASAQNGVVRVLTKDANLNDFEFKARASTSNTEEGGWNYRGDMAISVPIVEDKLAARAVVGYQDLSGWIDRPNKEDVNDAEIRDMRLKINAQPTEALSIGLSAWHSRSDFGGPPQSDDNYQHRGVIEEPSASDFDTYGLKIGYDFSSFSVVSSTGYIDYLSDAVNDIGTLVSGLAGETRLAAKVISEEIILTSTRETAWRWSLGGMYRDAQEDHFDQDIFNGVRVSPPNVDQAYDSQSLAVFGELTRRFLDGQIELTGGLRYFEDDVTRTDNLRSSRANDTFEAVSPRVVLTWHANEDLTAYASYAEGFRSGFPQTGLLLSLAPNFPAVDADTLHNYEVGVKGGLWGGRLSFDTALYYMDWQDVQQSLGVQVTPTLFAIGTVNGESASGVGVDFGVTARPAEGFELGVTFSWNDLTFDSDVVDGAGNLVSPEGSRVNGSPELTSGAFADYGFSVGGNGYQGQLSVSANYTSEIKTGNALEGDSILLGRISFAVSSPRNWTATVFVDNVTDESGSPVKNNILPAFLDWDSRVRPRTVGAQVDCRF